jgi:dihydroxyacid dehydratase/phosphogluconate dehydratase
MFTEYSREGGGAAETPMGSPESEKGFFTSMVRTGDAVQIDLNRVSG